jgi:hypothetical protein
MINTVKELLLFMLNTAAGYYFCSIAYQWDLKVKINADDTNIEGSVCH